MIVAATYNRAPRQVQLSNPLGRIESASGSEAKEVREIEGERRRRRNSQRDEVGVADEAPPPERGVELDERPQLRLVAPHPREDHRDAPRLPRRRRFRRPVEPPAAAGPHGRRRRRRPQHLLPLLPPRRGESEQGFALFFSLASGGDGRGEEETDGDGVGRLLASAFRSSWILFFRFCFLLGSIYRPAFFEVCIGSLLVRHRHVTM